MKVRGEGEQGSVRVESSSLRMEFLVSGPRLPHFCTKSQASWLLRERVVR